jgi:hypothetical protein
MILGWSSSKIVSGISEHRPRWPPQPNLILHTHVGPYGKFPFPIGSYVKLSSAVVAILIERPNRRTHFWKRTIQWLFHQNFVLIEQLVSDKKIFMGISHRVLHVYVKLSSAVAAILVGVLKCRTQFWKRTTQATSNQDGRQAKNWKKGGWN